jgi:hypothetical protein
VRTVATGPCLPRTDRGNEGTTSGGPLKRLTRPEGTLNLDSNFSRPRSGGLFSVVPAGLDLCFFLRWGLFRRSQVMYSDVSA